MKAEYGWAVLKKNAKLDRLRYGFILPCGGKQGEDLFKYLIYSDVCEASSWCKTGDRLVKVKITEVRK